MQGPLVAFTYLESRKGRLPAVPNASARSISFGISILKIFAAPVSALTSTMALRILDTSYTVSEYTGGGSRSCDENVNSQASSSGHNVHLPFSIPTSISEYMPRTTAVRAGKKRERGSDDRPYVPTHQQSPPPIINTTSKLQGGRLPASTSSGISIPLRRHHPSCPA
jgi:hypothetical protein